jgi:hypothetical protein
VAPPLWLQSADAYVPLSPPPKSLGGLHEGIGAGSAAGIGGAAGLGAERRRLGAALRADFFLVDRFAAAFAVLRFLRAGAALFLVDRFFAFLLFAMIDLPILYPIRAVATPKPAPDTRCGSSHLTLGRPLFNRLPLQAPSPGSQLPWPDASAASGDKARL